MLLKNTLLQCSLCQGSVDEQKWTERYIFVSIENGQIQTGTFAREYASRFLPETFPSGCDWFTPSECFLAHKSCFEVIGQLAEEITPVKLFRLCQSLQDDNERSFAHPRTPAELVHKLAGCADPAAPLVPKSIIDEYKQQEPAVRKGGGPFPLPPEIILTIIEDLPPKELISFFNASFQTLSFAPLYLRHHLNRFLPHATLKNDASTLFAMLRAIGDIYTDKDYKELDEKWKLLDRLQPLAAILSGISEETDQPSWSFSEPAQPLAHPFGFQRFIAEVPTDVEEFSVYRRVLREGTYLGGLGWDSVSHGPQVFGSTAGVKKDVVIRNRENVLHYVTDQLGVKDLKFGDAHDLNGASSSQDWIGQSVRRYKAQLEIIADSLKIRSIRWLLGPNDEPEFGELILMKNSLMKQTCYSPQTYHTTYPDRDPDLIHGHGQFAVEVIPFNRGLAGITIYDDEYSFGKIGIETHYGNGHSDLVGWRSRYANYFRLLFSDERVEEIDVQTQYLSVLNRDIFMVVSTLTPSCGTADSDKVKMRTNKDRSHRFSCKRHPSTGDTPSPVTTLRAPNGHRISGLYFRFGKESTMESVGVLSEPEYE